MWFVGRSVYILNEIVLFKASEVSVFEINIRLVGGFLAIYALTNDKVRSNIQLEMF